MANLVIQSYNLVMIDLKLFSIISFFHDLVMLIFTSIGSSQTKYNDDKW